ncbi:MAG: bacterioferritin-associated ferredoxin [Woeseiaceae bacterium]|nr:bacterioferritin-associated ferredoxin [Woeseiaceae bacterium]
MYVCICKSVTDNQIRRAAARGVDNLLELQQNLGVATGCGKCAGAAQDVLDKANALEAGPVFYVPSSA